MYTIRKNKIGDKTVIELLYDKKDISLKIFFNSLQESTDDYFMDDHYKKKVTEFLNHINKKSNYDSVTKCYKVVFNEDDIIELFTLFIRYSGYKEINFIRETILEVEENSNKKKMYY